MSLLGLIPAITNVIIQNLDQLLEAAMMLKGHMYRILYEYRESFGSFVTLEKEVKRLWYAKVNDKS